MTGTANGEFTLWNGLTFNFETILQVKRIERFEKSSIDIHIDFVKEQWNRAGMGGLIPTRMMALILLRM